MLRRILVSVGVVGLLVWSGCGDDSNTSGNNGGNFQVGQTAILVVNPDPIGFTSVGVGAESAVTVTIGNSAAAEGTLRLTKVWLESDSTDLSITQPGELELAPGATTTLVVTYAPTDELLDTGNLVLEQHNAATKRVPISTLKQAGKLQIVPTPVVFGAVQGGTPKVIPVRVLNQGSSDVPVGSTVLEGEAADFDVIATYTMDGTTCNGAEGAVALEYPLVAAIDSGYCVDVQYIPFGGGSDVAQLKIYPPFDPNQPSQEVLTQAEVKGTEVGPEIDITPGLKLDFGPVPVDDQNEMSFFIVNDGSKDLTVDGVAKGEQLQDAFGEVEILTDVPADTLVAPGDENAIEVKVRFAPTQPYPAAYTPLGFIEVYSDDADEDVISISVFGQVASPKLQITPVDVVDFGIVAENLTSSKTFTLTNTGTVDLVVSSFTLAENSPAGEFAIKTAPSAPFTIPGNSSESTTLTFTNEGGPVGEEVWGKITFATNDPEGATSVNLRAQRTDKAACEIELQPESVNYGTVPYGHTKTMTINMKNVGSAPCSWSHATVTDGAGGFFPIPIPGLDTCTATPVSNSKYFEIVNPPPAIKDLIKPGESWPLEVQYVPEASIFSSALEDFFEFAGLVQVHLLDFAQLDENGNASIIRVPDAEPGVSVPCNLKGKSGVANVAAIPGEVKFAKTTVGCHSKTETITIYNTGKAPLSICNIALEACTVEFKLKSVPPIPACVGDGGGIVLTQATPIKIQLVYAPQDTSKDGCSLIIESNDLDTPALTVPLSGSGTYDDHQQDKFVQLSGQMVDVLFVVDNSGSMSDEQGSLSSNFGSFVGSASLWDTEYHIGVITTDMEEGNAMAAKLCGGLGGCKAENPRFVTNGNVDDFKKNVKVGDFGSGTEQGLVAAQTALSLPLTGVQGDPPKTCTADADCGAPAKCITSVLSPGKKICGGWNAEFLREDATLEIVFVSDEEDQSAAALSFYIDFFKSIKGFANENLFHAHAIVGDAGGCDGAGGSAAAGDRYAEVAKQTGGKFHSICDSNWAQKLQDIGSIVFGLKVQFFLSRPAIPETVVVKVGSSEATAAECATGWEYQPDTNSILFDEDDPCMPQENDVILVDYDVICYSE